MPDDPTVITLEEAIVRLGDNVVIALEAGGQWVFDPANRRIKRLDGRFFEIKMFDRGTFEQPGIYEEPALPHSQGEPRIIGNIKLSMNPRGFIRSSVARGLDGQEFTQALLSSLSNPQVVEYDERAVKSALISTNPQRIGGGFARVFLVREEFPDEEGASVEELKRTTDGRTLAALAALGF